MPQKTFILFECNDARHPDLVITDVTDYGDDKKIGVPQTAYSFKLISGQYSSAKACEKQFAHRNNRSRLPSYVLGTELMDPETVDQILAQKNSSLADLMTDRHDITLARANNACHSFVPVRNLDFLVNFTNEQNTLTLTQIKAAKTTVAQALSAQPA